MTIAEVREKCKSTLGGIPKDVLLIGILILAATISFGLGYLAGLDAGQSSNVVPNGSIATSSDEAMVVASKFGTKYYLPSCAGVSRISKTNIVSFASAATARAAGYLPAGNCTGL